LASPSSFLAFLGGWENDRFPGGCRSSHRRLGFRVSRRIPFVLAWISPGASHGVSKDAPPSVQTLVVHSRLGSPGLALWFLLASACPRQGTGLVPPSWFSTTLTAYSAVRSAGLLHPAADPGVRRVLGPYVGPSLSEAEASSCSGGGSFRDAPPFEVSPRSQPSAVSPRFSRTVALLPFAFKRRFDFRVFLRDRVHGLPPALRRSGPYNFLGFLLSSSGRLSVILKRAPRRGSVEPFLHEEGAPILAGVGRLGRDLGASSRPDSPRGVRSSRSSPSGSHSL